MFTVGKIFRIYFWYLMNDVITKTTQLQILKPSAGLTHYHFPFAGFQNNLLRVRLGNLLCQAQKTRVISFLSSWSRSYREEESFWADRFSTMSFWERNVSWRTKSRLGLPAKTIAILRRSSSGWQSRDRDRSRLWRGFGHPDIYRDSEWHTGEAFIPSDSSLA